MKETREQMKRLMEKIQMPEEGIAQLLEARKELEEADHWDMIVQTAEQVMAADGELSVLTQALARDRSQRRSTGSEPLSSGCTDVMVLLGRSESAL